MPQTWIRGPVWVPDVTPVFVAPGRFWSSEVPFRKDVTEIIPEANSVVGIWPLGKAAHFQRRTVGFDRAPTFEAIVNTGDNLAFRGAFNNPVAYKAFLDSSLRTANW